ncbi:MAG: hypothetical protein HQL15_04655 [Candidatus Omnitrophica bacterium]|nr:hypothetical protein [Candidatus Omnitrophota bacterium]
MKNVFLSMLVLAAMTSLSFADQVASRTIAGMVKSVSMADVVKGTKSEIVVADKDGKTVSILVKSTSTLYDADAKGITLDKIAANSSVVIIYMTTAEGVNEAKSVKIVK